MDDPFDLCLVALGRISVQNKLPVEEVLLRNRGPIDFVNRTRARGSLHRLKEL